MPCLIFPRQTTVVTRVPTPRYKLFPPRRICVEPQSQLIGNSAAALDLANMSQTSPRTSLPARTPEARDKSSEWPQYAGPPRGTDSVSRASDRRVVTNPNLTLSAADMNGKLTTAMSASGTPLIPQLHGQIPLSRRGSPSSLLEGISSRSVPTTPLGIPTSNPMLKAPGTPLGEPLNGRLGDLPPLSGRISAQFDNGPMYNGNQSGHDDVCCLLSCHETPLTCLNSNMMWRVCMAWMMVATALMASKRTDAAQVGQPPCTITMVLAMVSDSHGDLPMVK